MKTGVKHDSGKPQWSLLPWSILRDTVKVLTFGAKKYKPENWKKIDDPINRYFDAMMRHILAVKAGEYLDSESKLPHMAHAVCCVLFLAWHYARVDSGFEPYAVFNELYQRKHGHTIDRPTFGAEESGIKKPILSDAERDQLCRASASVDDELNQLDGEDDGK